MKRLTFLLFALMLAGCAQLGMAPADTFNKKLAAGYTTVEGLAEGAIAAKLAPKDNAHVVLSLRTAVQGLDLAKSMHDTACPAGSPPSCVGVGADAKLQATLVILTALQTYLATAQGK